MLMRRCEACKQPIPQKQFAQIALAIRWSDRDEQADSVEECFGDYCDGCVASGAAMEDLVSGLTKYKGLEPDKKKQRGAGK